MFDYLLLLLSKFSEDHQMNTNGATEANQLRSVSHMAIVVSKLHNPVVSR